MSFFARDSLNFDPLKSTCLHTTLPMVIVVFLLLQNTKVSRTLNNNTAVDFYRGLSLQEGQIICLNYSQFDDWHSISL